jgi:spermidine/putrescine-binding protein
MRSSDHRCPSVLHGLSCKESECSPILSAFVSSRISKRLNLWGQSAVIALLAVILQGCDQIFRVDEDQTGFSEEAFTKVREQQRDLNIQRNLSGFGDVINGVVIERDIAPKAVGALEQRKVGDELLELYTMAARQAPAIQKEQFHKIEDLERRDRDVPALVWWLDREANAYPDSAADIQKLKRELPAGARLRHADGSVTINVLTRSGYFNPAVLDDFERENPRTNVRIYCSDTGDQMLQLLQAEAELQRKFNASSSPHAFDIAMPSDSAVAALAAKDWLAPIADTPAVGEEEFQRNMTLVDSDFRNWISRQGSSINIDLNRYCIPYCWSLTGIAYNSAFIDELPFSWAALLNPVDFPTDSVRKRFRRTSMLLNPRRAIETALLYLANMPVELPTLRTIESAERLLTDSATICKGLPDVIDDPDSKFLVVDLNQFLKSLQEPLGHNVEEMARALSQVQDEILWLLLKLDLVQSSVPLQKPSSTNLERKEQSISPLTRIPTSYATALPSPVVNSMRQLALITYDDLRLAVSFLKRLADIEHRMNLLLAGNPQGSTDPALQPTASLLPAVPRGYPSEWPETSPFVGQNNLTRSDYIREIKIIQAALQTLKKGLNREQPQRPDEIAAGFSSAQRRADALLDSRNGFNPEGKFQIAIDLLFRGPETTDVEKTGNSVSLLAKQDNSETALENPEIQSKVNAALSYLQKQSSYVSYFLTDSDTARALESGKVILGQATGPDAARVALKNEHIGFALPGEGVLGTAECFVILNYSRSAEKRNIGACRAFLNYLLRPQNAAKMVDYSKYASTESAATAFIDREVRNGASYIRPRDLTTVRLLPVLNDEGERMYAHGAAPLVPSKVLLEHPEYRETKSLFGVLFQAQRPH